VRTSLYIIITVSLGIMVSYFFLPESLSTMVDTLINISLCVTLFFVGISIGRNKHLFKDLKKTGLKVLILPGGTIIGSLIGGIVTGFILNRSLTLSLAIASGMGWYSISSGIILPVAGAEGATIAFIANMFREMLTFLLVPIIAKKVSPYCAISIGGATTMDVTLPIIARSTNDYYALIAFIHGSIISLIVPILVSFFSSL